ncbi:short-chain dehydrogenase/reductase SDR [Streptomyces tibetensis]|uniref:short-chain dehydrogenase/reductase SDR n=1 Tax=Streptomyces tibetensis TaxID=2382123 RepID=UPI0033C4A237
MEASTTWAEGSLDDYAERTAATKKQWEVIHGQQPGDPAKFADSLLKVADLDQPPLRFVAGDDCLAAVEAKANQLLVQVETPRELGSGLAHTLAV